MTDGRERQVADAAAKQVGVRHPEGHVDEGAGAGAGGAGVWGVGAGGAGVWGVGGVGGVGRGGRGGLLRVG
jgi:hypothetical protein